MFENQSNESGKTSTGTDNDQLLFSLLFLLYKFHLPPDNTNLGSTDGLGALINIANTLTQIKLGFLLRVASLNLHNGSTRMNNVLRTLEGKMLGLNVQSMSLSWHFCNE